VNSLLLLATLPLLPAGPPVDASSPPPQKVLEIRMHIYRGDPLGSREAGTLKVLAEPTLRTLIGQTFEFISGGEVVIEGIPESLTYVPSGTNVRGTVARRKDGRWFLDLALEITLPVERSPDSTRVEKQGTRIFRPIALGEVVKVRASKSAEQEQIWLELTVSEQQVDWNAVLSSYLRN